MSQSIPVPSALPSCVPLPTAKLGNVGAGPPEGTAGPPGLPPLKEERNSSVPRRSCRMSGEAGGCAAASRGHPRPAPWGSRRPPAFLRASLCPDEPGRGAQRHQDSGLWKMGQGGGRGPVPGLRLQGKRVT